MDKVNNIVIKNKWLCNRCDLSFNTRSLLFYHKRESHSNLHANPFYKSYCKFCGREFTTKSGNTRHEKYCAMNPNRIDPPTVGSTIPEAIRKKISDTQKKNYKNKSIWKTQIDNRKSYAEQYFLNIFSDLKYQFHVLSYFLDFADPIKKIYIEIDGEQHYNDPKIIEHDKIRFKDLEKAGWTLIDRVRWSSFTRLSPLEKEEYIKLLRSFISNAIPINTSWEDPLIKKKKEYEMLQEKGFLDKRGHKNLSMIGLDELNRRKDLILQSGVDLFTLGWQEKVSKITGLSRRQIAYIVKYFNIDCYKRHSPTASI